ncbi:MAG: anhydro-N-acetylmuramic acid kinase [Candidatus Gastranaerophilales bacterium]|nr:anhydro-N-acetylmuramic acid kinase [Candidatus Gastranaerophilales bacterium]
MKKHKTIISMMSGTSVDAIDACLLRIYEDLSFKIIDNYSLSYPDEVRKKLIDLANNNGNVSDVCFMNFVTGELFAKCACLLLKKSGMKSKNIDFISSHGQTIFHIPEKREISGIKTRSTLQIGDISVISQKTGITTIGDYRTKDIAAGGQGAPLVAFADKILFGTEKNRLIQNIGGISNVTVLSKKFDIFAFDNAPGNILIDYFVNKFFNKPFDKNGEIAAKGNIDNKWLNELLKEPYYYIEPPKTTGREFFNNEYAQRILKTAPANKYDIIATITALTAKVITDSYKNFILPKIPVQEVILGGGGAYNNTLIKYMQNYMPELKIKTHEDFGIPNKLKEAVAFAYLGYYTINKEYNNIPSCTGAKVPVIMGKIAY